MSAPPNMAENMPITELIRSDQEVVDVAALTKQLQDAEVRNARIKKKKEEQEAKRLKEEKDEADRLAREEAEQKTEKVNKKKRVSAI